MRALRFLALAAALIAPAAAAHAQVGVYVGHSARYRAPIVGFNYGAAYPAPAYPAYAPYGRWAAQPAWGVGYGWHDHRDWRGAQWEHRRARGERW